MEPLDVELRYLNLLRELWDVNSALTGGLVPCTDDMTDPQREGWAWGVAHATGMLAPVGTKEGEFEREQTPGLEARLRDLKFLVMSGLARKVAEV